MIEEVQHAAERRRNYQVTEIRCSPLLVLADAETLADAFLREHLADDDLPIDNDFLRSLGFAQVEGAFEQTTFLDSLETWPEFTNREGIRRWSLRMRNREGMIPGPLCPQNRGEVRALLRKLKIQFEELQSD